jgi:threonyl-tRNA synthetase
MIQITLPDGSRREFPGPVTVAEVAASIGAGLAKAALAGKVDGRLVDTSHRIEADAPGHRHRQGRRRAGDHPPLHGAPAGLCGEGAVPRRAGDHRPGDRERLLLRLRLQAPVHARRPGGHREAHGRAGRKDEPVVRRVLPRDEAVAHFKGLGEHYKAEIIASIPAGEDVSLYREGGFEDLCRGPHVPSTGKLKHFKLMKVAGAYWRGDHRNEMLQRIYGTAWASKDDLQQYLTMLEEAEKRDHRKLGRELDLFHIDEHAPGTGVLAPQGLDGVAAGGAVHAPRLPRQRLPGGQGPADPGPDAVGEDRPLGQVPRQHVHHRIGKARLRAQADELPGPHPDLQAGHQELPRPAAALRRVRPVPPQRAHGGLHGIMRVRGFTQDDGHIFCTEDQILPECVAYTGAAAEGLRRLRLHRHHLQGGHRPGSAHRLRRRSGTRPSTR